MIKKENTEALVITSNVKYIPVFQKNLITKSLETKNKNFILNIIYNIKKNTYIKNFLIAHYLKIDNKDSLNYQINRNLI